ncbi:beta-N-acetylhexosaminidase [bacterium F11]|nr:beta-N-acetylhexosaminidase [bacterium F11]
MATQLEDLIGSKLVIGFPGTKITPQVIGQFRATHAGGVLFYRINFQSPDQLRECISNLEEALQRKLLVCVDHEGGRVIMYRDGVTIFPDNLAFGHTQNVEWATKAGTIAAKELRALGTDVNFAPVLDVLTDAYSPNIGIRSYGKDHSLVAKMGAAYIQALQAGGVSATAKHFPGKGHAPVDAHLKLPTILSTWKEMKEVHLQPFIQAIQVGVDVMMSSHPKYPRLDPNPSNIATFSRRIITDCLRDELGFKGVISSDDLEMGAVTETTTIDIAAVKAVAAGHDLILSCHDFDSERKVFQGLLEAYRGRLLPLDELEESVERIHQLKSKRQQRFEGSPGPDPEGQKTALQIASAGTRILQDNAQILPISSSLRQNVGVVFPKLSSFAKKIMIEKDFEDEKTALHKRLGHFPGKHVIETYAIDPQETDIALAGQLAIRSSVILFFCFDAHLFPNQQKILKALQNTHTKLIIILMRDPYDQAFLRPSDVGVTAFGFRGCQIEAVLNTIYGQN